MLREHSLRMALGGMAVSLSLSGAAIAATPTAEQALKLVPVQKDVEIDRPLPQETSNCTIKAEKQKKQTGWVVRGGEGNLLRKFVDSNGDNVVDQWSYFKDGLEVYRDIDSNFNGKPDQYRWFQTGGTRWGMDKNEDGAIDGWKVISAEEVSAEVVAAIKNRDVNRFTRLLITPDELKDLGLGESQLKEVRAKLTAAPAAFRAVAASQKTITPQTQFANFGGSQPGIVPAGSEGMTQDLMVYENVAAMVETGDKHDQVHIGTLVRVGNTWRLIDAPQLQSGNDLAGPGYFYRNNQPVRTERAPESPDAPSEKLQEQMAELEKLEAAIATASPEKQGELNLKRAALLEQLAEDAGDPTQRGQWLRQLADTISAAVQQGTFPAGVERLEEIEKKLAKKPADQPLVPYFKFRFMSAEYGQNLMTKKDPAKVQAEWNKRLEEFVKAYPKSSDCPEAMLQLAVANEFSGDDEKSATWFGRIVTEFPNSTQAKKALGAKTRLESVGKRIQIEGPDVDGKTIGLAQLRGKVVLVQYWAKWCEPCKADMVILKDLHNKYGDKGFVVLGVSLDTEKEEMLEVIKEERLPWQHIYEPGGLESRLANEMGILTLPTMMLIDKEGKVISRNIHGSEIDAEVKKQLQ